MFRLLGSRERWIAALALKVFRTAFDKAWPTLRFSDCDCVSASSTPHRRSIAGSRPEATRSSNNPDTTAQSTIRRLLGDRQRCDLLNSGISRPVTTKPSLAQHKVQKVKRLLPARHHHTCPSPPHVKLPTAPMTAPAKRDPTPPKKASFSDTGSPLCGSVAEMVWPPSHGSRIPSFDSQHGNVRPSFAATRPHQRHPVRRHRRAQGRGRNIADLCDRACGVAGVTMRVKLYRAVDRVVHGS